MQIFARKLAYPKADPARRPSDWWYFGRAIYIGRHDYLKVFTLFVLLGAPLGLAGLLLELRALFLVAAALAWLGLVLFVSSLLGLYAKYGPPARHYIRQLLRLGGLRGPLIVADLHIGTYRHAYLLAEQLTEALVYSVDCWDESAAEREQGIMDVRALEPAPTGEPRIRPLRAHELRIPLQDQSCDVVVLGFGAHEIPAGEPRQRLFAEARRILRPGGRLLLFEHGADIHTALLMGPVALHLTSRAEWRRLLEQQFVDVRYQRSPLAVELFAARRDA